MNSTTPPIASRLTVAAFSPAPTALSIRGLTTASMASVVVGAVAGAAATVAAAAVVSVVFCAESYGQNDLGGAVSGVVCPHVSRLPFRSFAISADLAVTVM